MHLYELEKIYYDIVGSEIPDEEKQKVLDITKKDIHKKGENIVKYIKNTEGEIDALDKEIKRLQQKKKTLQNSNKWYKNYLLETMQRLETPKIDSTLFTIRVKKNRPKTIIKNEELVPEKYWRIERKPDLKALSEARQNGELEGVVEFSQDESLYIK